MTPAEAAWVRDNVWTTALAARAEPVEACPCQYGLTGWCINGGHGHCDSRTVAFPETHITDKSGACVLAAGFRTGHAPVWLADRTCAWTCRCSCHATPAPTAGGLPRFELVPLFDVGLAPTPETHTP